MNHNWTDTMELLLLSDHNEISLVTFSLWFVSSMKLYQLLTRFPNNDNNGLADALNSLKTVFSYMLVCVSSTHCVFSYIESIHMSEWVSRFTVTLTIHSFSIKKVKIIRYCLSWAIQYFLDVRLFIGGFFIWTISIYSNQTKSSLMGNVINLARRNPANVAMASTFVQEAIAKDKVVIFSKTYCPYCTMAKEVSNIKWFMNERSKLNVNRKMHLKWTCVVDSRNETSFLSFIAIPKIESTIHGHRVG